MIKIDFNIDEIYDLISDEEVLRSKLIIRDGFAFTSLSKTNIFDALIVRKSTQAHSFCDSHSVGSRTADECVELINRYGLKNAVFITNDASIIKQCPTLTSFTLYLDSESKESINMSYLYLLSGVRNFSLGDKHGIDEIYTGGTSKLLFQKLQTLKSLNMCGKDEKSNVKTTDIQTIENFDLPQLLKLSIIQCGITNLKGIENCPKLQSLELSNMRFLSDISDIGKLSMTLRSLCIESCPKIADFSEISELENLEYLELKGNNELPSLDFIKGLHKLKYLILTMNVRDGDIGYLKNLQYVDAICKRHYNLKNKDLPKDRTDLKFEFV